MEDDEEDDVNVNLFMGLRLLELEIPIVVRVSRDEKSSIIERHRHDMHTRTMSNYFADELVYEPHIF